MRRFTRRLPFSPGQDPIPPCRIHGALHKRLFFWFAGTIVVSALMTFGVMRIMGEQSVWTSQTEGPARFIANRFAENWDDQAAVDHLANALSKDLGFEIAVRDTTGTLISHSGKSCRATYHIPVTRDGQTLGSVSVGLCPPHSLWHSPLPLVIALVTMWAASGWFARRITRPLRQVTQVASEIGRGNLSARVQLSHHQVGEVRVLADVINDMAARIAQQLSDQKSLLAAVSHEIRTPLARMRFLAEMARTQGCADKTADSLDREIVEVDKLVGDLLASSRLDFDARSDVPLVPADLARRAVEQLDLDPTILDVEENLPSFDGDPTLLVRALVNLLENARKHAGSAETFRVYFRTGRICFVVEDRGPGFEPDECEKVFEPFYKRSKSNASTSESIGLGLSLVKRIAKTHGGIAYAKNREGGGACVGIEIPRLRMAR